MAINQYKAGTVSYLNVLIAQTAALQNERTTLDIRNRRVIASVLLVKALGGGWHITDQELNKEIIIKKK